MNFVSYLRHGPAASGHAEALLGTPRGGARRAATEGMTRRNGNLQVSQVRLGTKPSLSLQGGSADGNGTNRPRCSFRSPGTTCAAVPGGRKGIKGRTAKGRDAAPHPGKFQRAATRLPKIRRLFERRRETGHHRATPT